MDPSIDADGQSVGPVGDEMVRQLLEAGRDQRWITETARYGAPVRVLEEDAAPLDRPAEGPGHL